MIGLFLALMLSCESAPSTARSTVQQPTTEVIYARGREALAAAGITELVWGLTPFVSATSVQAQWSSTLELVGSRLGIPLKVVVGANYADVERALLSGEVDMAVMSPYAYVRAKAVAPEIQVFATHIAGGTESYGAYIVGREDGPVRTMADLKGRRFAFVDDRSSSGWLFPAARMLDAGLNPLTDVDGAFYGAHEKVIQAIVDGHVAAGATYDGALAEGRGRIPAANNLRIIARTHRIPYDAYVARPGFPAAAIPALQRALGSVSTRDPVGRKALAPLMGTNGFVPADDSHYRVVRKVEARVREVLARSGMHLPSVVRPPADLPPLEPTSQ
jgi:phosphate/phosphite/phosphonate ABC transporter binding protein